MFYVKGANYDSEENICVHSRLQLTDDNEFKAEIERAIKASSLLWSGYRKQAWMTSELN